MSSKRLLLVLTLAFGACGVAPPVCDATTCANGCCDAQGVCQFVSQQTCGMNGLACQTCIGTQICSFGICVTPDTGSGGGGASSSGGGGGTAGSGGGGGTSSSGGGGGTSSSGGGGGTSSGGGGGTSSGGGGGSNTCTPGGACATNPSRPCILGVVSCVGGAATCVDSTTFAPAGSSCGANQTCDAFGACQCASGALSCQGQCVACTTPANAVPTCSGASCDFTCMAGFHRCGSSCLSDTSVNSCGTSCTPCAASGGTPVCTAGQCGISSCNSGFLLCNGTCAACSTPPNATPACSFSGCGFECNPGHKLCQGTCAACTTPSNATASCNGTACDFTCNGGFERVGQGCLRVASWQQSSAAAGPPGRYGGAMTFDRARNRVLLFGGESVANNVFVHQNDTWEFSGTAWSGVFSSARPATPPSNVVITTTVYSMAYDVTRARTVLLSGANGTTTWEYNGATQAWTQVFPTTSPSFNSARLAWDPASGRVIAVNRGSSSLETWSWNGTTWTLLSSTGPALVGFALATDTARNKVMLFGGATSNTFASETNDLWEWTGFGWSARVVSGTLPPRQRNAVMVYDASRSKLVLLGGKASGGNDGLTWEFDGTRWSWINGPAAFGDMPGLAYDETRQATVLFSLNRNTTSTQTWELKR